MTKQSNNSDDDGHYVPGNPLEAAHLRLIKHFKDSGITVTEEKGLSPGQYIATIPQGRRPQPVNYGAIISVEWGYELHSIKLSARDWALVKSGEGLSKRGKGYYYEAQFFWDYWNFGGGLSGSLYVDYGNDGANGYMGSLRGATIEELKK